MKNIQRYLLFLFLLLAQGYNYFGQTGNYFVQSFLPKTYLSGANNFGVTQDSSGLIFIANINGILFFDGVNWDICKREDEVSVNCIGKTYKGEIIVGTADGDIARVTKNERGKYIYESLFDSLNISNKPSEIIRQIITLHHSTFFLSADKLIEYRDNKLIFYEPEDRFHTRAFVLGQHLFITEVNKQISVLVKGKLKKVNGTEELAEDQPFFCYPLGKDRYAIGYRQSGIYMAKYNQKQPENTEFSKKKTTCDAEISSAGINNGCLMKNGNFIVTTNKKGAFELDTNLNIIRWYTNKNGTNDDNIKAAFEDRNGNLWLALFYGVTYIERSSRLFQYTRENGIAGSVQSAVYFENKLFIATDKGVQYFDSLGEKFINLQDFDIQTWYLYKLNKKLFLATDKGMFVYENNKINQVNESRTFYILNDPTQTHILYAGTDNGVECYWVKENGVSLITTYKLNTQIKCIANDANGNSYFVSNHQTIYYLNSNKSQSLDSITFRDGLPQRDFETYLFSYKNKLKLGTDSGIYAINRNNKGGFNCIKDPDFWPLTNSSQVFRATQFGDGIICYQKYINPEKNKSEEKITYISENAFKSGESSKLLSHLSDVLSNMISLDSIRKLIFISANEGLFILKSNSTDEKKFALSLKTLHANRDTLIENANFSPEAIYKEYDISFENNEITAVMGFTSFETTTKMFCYKLIGRDQEYSKWSKVNTIKLGNLHEGSYTLSVKARTELEPKEYFLSVPFKINPPWYRSIYAYIFYGILFLAFIYLVVRLNSKRLVELNRKLEATIEERTSTISHQKEEIEHKQKEILDSINYAQRIQRALLASDKLLKDNLPEHFVFFQPKDVVSGDFYWAAVLADKRFALVTADSTGHGVPGAIMSMLNISCLKEAVESEKLVSAKAILNHTRKKVIETLANDGSESGGKDGMDCSLLCLDLKKNQFSYAAANNPVWIVRKNSSEENELIELSPDKMPVGKHDRDSISFNEHVFELKNNDVIYTLTDGLPDQFGGPKGKKYMYKQLKELLTSISQLSVKTQREMLEQAFENWKGEQEQVDDITLIGIKIKAFTSLS